MTKIYLIRHAEAEGNLYRRIHGRYDSLVTENGKRQIEALSKRFEGEHIDAVYVSPLLRTHITAAAICTSRGLTPKIDADLTEADLGQWEDRTFGDVEWEDRELLSVFNLNPAEWSVEGSERLEDMPRRMAGALTRIGEENDGKTVAVFTHGLVKRAFLCSIMGIPLAEISSVKHSDNTAVTLLHYDGGQFEIQYINDVSHMPDELSTFSRQQWWRNKSGLDRGNLRFFPMDLDTKGKEYLNLRRDTWMISMGSLEGFPGKELLENAKRLSKENPGYVMEALQGGNTAGIIEIDPEIDQEENAGYINFYYVDEKYRGGGYSVQLLGYAVSFYRGMGRTKLRLRAESGNERAVRFYEKHGFTVVGEEVTALGRYVIMERSIEVKKRVSPEQGG